MKLSWQRFMTPIFTYSSVGWVDDRKPNRFKASLDFMDVGYFNPTYCIYNVDVSCFEAF